jgi:hypothetical protein
MQLSTQQSEQLTASLSSCVGPRKKKLLPLILSDWAQVDLEAHLNQPPPKQVAKERQQLLKLACRAAEIAQIISDLNPVARFTIAGWQLEAFEPVGLGSKVYVPKPTATHSLICEAAGRLGKETEWLNEIGVAATNTAAMWTPLPMRHATTIRYLVLQDLAAISEYATEKKARGVGWRFTTANARVNRNGCTPHHERLGRLVPFATGMPFNRNSHNPANRAGYGRLICIGNRH